jgi:hypothetical protein
LGEEFPSGMVVAPQGEEPQLAPQFPEDGKSHQIWGKVVYFSCLMALVHCRAGVEEVPRFPLEWWGWVAKETHVPPVVRR